MIPLTEKQIEILSWLKTSPRLVDDVKPSERTILEQLVRLGLAAEARTQKHIDGIDGELLGWHALPHPDWNP